MSAPAKDLSHLVVIDVKRQPHGEVVQVVVRCDYCDQVKTVRRRPLLLSNPNFTRLCSICGLASVD